MKEFFFKKRWVSVCLFLLVIGGGGATAQTDQIRLVKIVGQEFRPDKIQAWPGDILKICNEGIYRRQPYSQSGENKFGKRKPDPSLYLKDGDCMEFKIKNSTSKWLKMKVRDAIAGKAKLEINVNPKIQ